jgi:hypothetical protein
LFVNKNNNQTGKEKQERWWGILCHQNFLCPFTKAELFILGEFDIGADYKLSSEADTWQTRKERPLLPYQNIILNVWIPNLKKSRQPHLT